MLWYPTHSESAAADVGISLPWTPCRLPRLPLTSAARRQGPLLPVRGGSAPPHGFANTLLLDKLGAAGCFILVHFGAL